MRTEILDEDKDVIVVYKPAGIATQSADIRQGDVVSELKNYLCRAGKGPIAAGKEPYLGIIHRLDQPVEGLLVFAKKQKGAAELSRQLREGVLCKRYYAVLCGRPREREGELTDTLWRDAGSRTGAASRTKEAGPAGQRAVLKYSVLEYWQERQIALAEIQIKTGRFHQIRVQMANGGIPILGDRKYGGETCCALAEELQVNTVALCAYSLEFIHPFDKKKMQFRIKPRGKAFSFFSQLSNIENVPY